MIVKQPMIEDTQKLSYKSKYLGKYFASQENFMKLIRPFDSTHETSEMGRRGVRKRRGRGGVRVTDLSFVMTLTFARRRRPVHHYSFLFLFLSSFCFLSVVLFVLLYRLFDQSGYIARRALLLPPHQKTSKFEIGKTEIIFSN